MTGPLHLKDESADRPPRPGSVDAARRYRCWRRSGRMHPHLPPGSADRPLRPSPEPELEPNCSRTWSPASLNRRTFLPAAPPEPLVLAAAGPPRGVPSGWPSRPWRSPPSSRARPRSRRGPRRLRLPGPPALGSTHSCAASGVLLCRAGPRASLRPVIVRLQLRLPRAPPGAGRGGAGLWARDHEHALRDHVPGLGTPTPPAVEVKIELAAHGGSRWPWTWPLVGRWLPGHPLNRWITAEQTDAANGRGAGSDLLKMLEGPDLDRCGGRRRLAGGTIPGSGADLRGELDQ